MPMSATGGKLTLACCAETLTRLNVTSMETAHAVLTGWWRATGDEPPIANVGEATVQEIERRYGLTLPEDFRLYLLHAAPSDDFWDNGDAIWWSPERLKNIPEEYEHPIDDPRIAQKAQTYLFFADYMIWSWAWAICCEEGEDRGKVALIGGAPDRIVASSFTEFVKAYIADPLAVS